MGLAADYVSFFFGLLFRLRVIFAKFGSDSFVHFALWLALLNLSEVQFYWSRTSKNRDRHAQSTLFVIHFFDNTIEVVKRLSLIHI